MFIALAVFLFQKAACYEPEFIIMTPDKEQEKTKIEEFNQKIDKMISLQKQSMPDEKKQEDVDREYKHTKLVVWLLNRPAALMKQKREEFYEQINFELNTYTDVESINSPPILLGDD